MRATAIATAIDRTEVPSRSNGELVLYMAQHPCPACGGTDTHILARREVGGHTVYEGPCPGCGLARSFRFQRPPSVLAPAGGGLAPGDAPSRLFDRGQLLSIAELALAEVAGFDDRSADLPALTRASARLSLATTALVEADRFVGPDLSGRIAEVRARRDRVEAQRQGARTEAGYVPVDKAALLAHGAWLRRGRTGEGRLVARGPVLVDAALRGARLSAAHLAEARLDRANLSYADLVAAELSACSAIAIDLTSANLARAVLRGCTLRRADLRLAVLSGARIEGGDWRGATADRGDWSEVRASRVDLRATMLGDVVLDHAELRNCDLRDARLARVTVTARLLGAARGARFVECDLRRATMDGRVLAGVTFERCKLGGLVGRPVLEGAVHVIDCEGDAGRLDGGAAVLGWG